MSNGQRVYITGLGALTATGESADATWDALLKGQNGLHPIKQWDLSTWTHQLGGEIKDYQPAKMLPDRKLLKVIARQDVLGINAAMQAVTHSQLIAYRDLICSKDDVEQFNDETGVYVASPGNKYFQQYDFLPLLAKTKGDLHAFADELFSEVHPMWLLRILPNNVLAYTGITYGFKGINHNITNHAVGGMQAIIEAVHAIRQGQIARAVVIGYDVGTEPQALFYYEKLGVISARHLKPFDKAHDGTILAEGASALVLESEASVAARNATCYGEILGGHSATEAEGLFSIDEKGVGLTSLLSDTLGKLQLTPTDLEFLVAHGNGNQKSDLSEAQAISALFGANTIPTTAFKWSMGHTLCASGVLDTVLTSYALRNRCVPGIANLEELALGCASLNVSRSCRTFDTEKAHALIINRGFASMNTCLVIKACD